MQHFVYELVNPLTDIPFYVGITENAYKRFKSHMYNRDRCNPAKNAIVQSLKSDNLVPIMKIRETVDGLEHAQKREKYWINYYLVQGIPLTNIVGQPKIATDTPPVVANGLYGVGDVLKLLKISRTTLYNLIEKGEITPVEKPSYLKKRGKVQFRESDVEKLLQEDPSNYAA